MDLPECSKVDPPSQRQYDVDPKVEKPLEVAKTLSTTEYRQLILIKSCGEEDMKKVMNYARDLISKRKKKLTAPGEACEHPSMDVSGTSQELDLNAPATKVSLIIRGDVIAARSVFFADTEKVTEAKSHKNVSGDLAIVDERGVLVFWCYIKRENVCKFNTQLTGLDKLKVESGIEINMVKALLNALFRDKELWGADFSNDLKSLNYDSTAEIPFKVRDIQGFYLDSEMKPISLAYLAGHFLGESIQTGSHSSIRDARFTANCYKKMKKMQTKGLTRFECPVMDELRKYPENNQKNKQEKMKYDRCTCGVVGKKKKYRSTVFESFANLNVDDYYVV